MASSTSNASVCSLALIAAALFASHPAGADDAATEACLLAHTAGQRAQKAGRLLEARAQFLTCAAATCPDLAKQQCVPWLAEVEAKIPSVVFAVRDESGADLSRVRVSVDGKLLTQRLDGRSIPLDPGSRRVSFEADGFVPVTQTFLLREGERSRTIQVELTRKSKPAAPAPTSSSPGVPWTVWALGGVGVAALGAGGYFFFDGKSDVSEMRDSCAPDCDPSRVDSAKRKVRTADVLLGVGVVAVAAATWIALTADPPKEAVQARVRRAPRQSWPSF